MSSKTKISELMFEILGDGVNEGPSIEILETWLEIPRDPNHGDYAFPCFRFSKLLKNNPSVIAEEFNSVALKILPKYPEIASIEVAGPYLNFRISKSVLAGKLIPEILGGSYLEPRKRLNERVMIEYSQPNTHKAFHVGHTRNATLGDALVRIFEWCGYDVIAANYIGDEGTHIAKCLWYFENHFEGVVPDINLGEFLGDLYTQATIMLDFSTLTQVPILDVVTAEVTSKVLHPKNENWQVVVLKYGDASAQVVCGGTGFEAGDVVALALIGARIGGRTIEEAEREGITSTGMICSQKELGLGENQEQIFVFPNGTPSNIPLAEFFRKPDVPINVSVVETMRERSNGVAQTLKALEARDPHTLALWEKTKAWSMDAFYQIYDWLGCRFDHYFFESEVGERGKQIVLDLHEQGILMKSEGAIGADLSEKGLPFFLLLKSDGTGLYATKDLALAQEKFEKYAVDRSVYVVDASQSLHFQQVFATLSLMGYEKAQNCYHLAYGLVVLPDGKMSSREGNVILFSELRQKLHDKICGEYLDKYRGIWSGEEIENASHIISVATIRYGMLNQDNMKNIVFDLDEWTARTGNTGPYLLYAYARTQSILREVGALSLNQAEWTLLCHETEATLLNTMSKFEETVWRAQRDFRPNVLCHYLYQLCKDFSRMYDQCSVIHAQSLSLKATRALLIKAFGVQLKSGLSLLGIKVLERM